MEIVQISQNTEYAAQINEWSCGLWYPDFEEAGVEKCFVVLEDNGQPIAYQTVSPDYLCVAIEVAPDYQEKGIAWALIEESNCWKPERNECPEFWEAIATKMKKIQGMEDMDD